MRCIHISELWTSSLYVSAYSHLCWIAYISLHSNAWDLDGLKVTPCETFLQCKAALQECFKPWVEPCTMRPVGCVGREMLDYFSQVANDTGLFCCFNTRSSLQVSLGALLRVTVALIWHLHVMNNNTFLSVWADNGDTCAKQYAGTGALKTDYTR